MAKLQASKMQTGEQRGDGLREKMVAINRVTKVVKVGRVLGFAALLARLHLGCMKFCHGSDPWSS